MSFAASNLKVFLATQPVDFRKGMDGLAAHVKNCFNLDPYGGALFVFRSKGADRIKVLQWDGTGLVLVYKRFDTKGIYWPKTSAGTLTLTRVQFDALFEGVDWRRIMPAKVTKPALM